MENTYEIFEKIINEKGLKPAQIVKKLNEKTDITGVKFTSALFSDWKSGKSLPKYDKLRILAEFLGVSVETLQGIEQKKQEILNIIDDDINRARTDQEITLLTQFRKLDELGKMRVIQALMNEVDKL